jgi:hypothetical protein
MTLLDIKPSAPIDAPVWKTESYHDHEMHVCTERLTSSGEAPSGHGNQWAFTVKVSLPGTDALDEELVSAKSDAGLFYGSQAIAEGMGFLRGRELIDAR